MPLQPIYEQWDSALNEEERAIVASLSSFSREVIAPFAQECDRRPSAMPRAIVKEWAALGMNGLQTPVEYDGLNATYFAKIRAAQELARWSFACAFSLNNMQGVTTRIAQYASEEQRQ